MSSALGTLFAPTFAAYATRYPDMPAHKLAVQRVRQMHAALIALDDVPSGLPAMVGEMIDQHVPLLNTRPKCASVFSAYRRGICPDKPLAASDTLCGVGKLVTELWKRCADHGALRRLLLKGGPFPTSVRYVSAQLSRTAAQPETAGAVTQLLRLSMLGAYSHARIIAPPRTRCAIWRKSAPDLLDMFSKSDNRTSHQYFYLVAEFVLAATRMSPHLWHWVLSHKRYAEYERIVSAAGDTIRNNGKPSRISTAIAPRAWDPPASMFGFIASAGGKKKLSIGTQSHLSENAIKRVYTRAFASSRWGYAADLVAACPGSERIRAVAAATTDSCMRLAMSQLLPVECAIAQIVAQACSAKQSFTLSAVDLRTRNLQELASKRRTGTTSHCVIVCACCATWRSKAPVAGISRGTVGVKVLLPIGRGVVCNSCMQSYGLRVINLVGVVIRIRPRADAPLVQISICTQCGAPASGLVRFGARWVCEACARVPPSSGATCFVCKTVATSFRFTARNNGQPIEAHACAAHKPMMKGRENVNVVALGRMVLKRRRRYIRHCW